MQYIHACKCVYVCCGLNSVFTWDINPTNNTQNATICDCGSHSVLCSIQQPNQNPTSSALSRFLYGFCTRAIERSLYMNNSNTRIPKEAIWSRKANRVVIYIALRPSIVSESNPIHKLRRKKIYREIYCEKCMCLMVESQSKYMLWWNVLFDLIQLRAQ